MIDFIKRHKMLAFAFVICIYLMIKNSSIPYFFDPPYIISFLFDSPKSEFFSNLAPLVDMFTSAYVTSLIFYIFIEYIPTVKQEKNAKAILKPQLVNLHHYITELLSMIEYSAKSEKLLPTDNIADLDNLSIKDKDFFCNIQTFKNDESVGKGVYHYNILIDCDKRRDLILNICKDISATPNLSYCDSQLINIISEIQLSELLDKLPTPGDPLIKIDATVCYLGLGVAYEKLKSLQNDLSKLIDTKLEFVMSEMSKEEKEEWEKNREENLEKLLKQYPEISENLV